MQNTFKVCHTCISLLDTPFDSRLTHLLIHPLTLLIDTFSNSHSHSLHIDSHFFQCFVLNINDNDNDGNNDNDDDGNDNNDVMMAMATMMMM